MHFDKKKFFATLKLRGYTVSSVAKAVEISTVAMYRKINGTSDFYRDEIASICTLLKLDNAQMESIFFADDVSYA